MVKTDMEAPRHWNLSYFMVGLKSPGYYTRPLREITDNTWFGEMFFDNMRISH